MLRRVSHTRATTARNQGEWRPTRRKSATRGRTRGRATRQIGLLVIGLLVEGRFVEKDIKSAHFLTFYVASVSEHVCGILKCHYTTRGENREFWVRVGSGCEVLYVNAQFAYQPEVTIFHKRPQATHLATVGLPPRGSRSG